MPTNDGTLPRVQIQTVLYKTPPSTLNRFLWSVAKAVAMAKTSAKIREGHLVLGDCSPLQSLADEGVPELRTELGQEGLDTFDYEFFDSNLGSAGGHNRLFHKSDSEYVLILNPDVVASPYLIEELLLRMGQPGVGLVEGRQLPLEHPKHYDPATGETSWASTACVMMPKQVIADVGGFDSESFFLYCDDVDFSWRIRLAGYKVIFHPPARIFHDKRLDRGGHVIGNAAEEYYSAEAALIMTHKWSRPDLTELFLGQLESGSSLQREAAAAFKAKRDAGKLPTPLDPMHKVGEFDEFGRWAKHRW